jgi:actin-related protein
MPDVQGAQYRGLLKIKYPIEHGIVEDWNSMEKLWQYVSPHILPLLACVFLVAVVVVVVVCV